MGRRLRDVWLEVEFRRLRNVPYVQLSLRCDWDIPDEAKQKTRPGLAARSRATFGSDKRRAA